MNQFNDFKNEESHPAGEALHSVSSATQVDLVDRSIGKENSSTLSPEQTIDQQDPIAAKYLIEQVLIELLPYIASHGGHVELVDVRDSIVFIKFSGACVQCPLSFYTVTYGIERHIKVKVPWIVRVEVIED